MRFDQLNPVIVNTSLWRRAMRLGVAGCALTVGLLTSILMANDKPAKPSKPTDTKSLSDKPDKKPTSTEKAPPKKSPPAEASKVDNEPISPKRETAAIAFAQQHHLELAELLTRLKVSHPDQYTKALNELDKTRTRLEKATGNGCRPLRNSAPRMATRFSRPPAGGAAHDELLRRTRNRTATGSDRTT